MVSFIHQRLHDFVSMSSPPPVSEIVLVASQDYLITAYDLYSGTVLARYNGSRCPRNGIVIIGNDIFAASHVSPETGTSSICLYYLWSPSSMQSISLPEPVGPLAATVDGSYLFSGGISGQIHSLSVPSGDLIRSFSVHEKPVSCLAINCDGSLILSGSDDGTIAVLPIFQLLDASLDAKSRFSMFNRFTGHVSSVTGLAIGMGRSGSIMISSSLDMTCKVWNLVNGMHLQTMKFPTPVLCTVLDLSETKFCAGGTDGIIYKRRLKVHTRKDVVQCRKPVVWERMHSGGVVAMEMLNHGQMVLAVSEDGGVCVTEVDGGNMISRFGEKIGGVTGFVVVKGGSGFRQREIVGGYGGRKDVGLAVKEVGEMERVLKVEVGEQSQAICNLGSAIEINQKMLKLMLKEAKTIAKLNNQANRKINHR